MELGLRRAIKLALNHPETGIDYRHAAVLAKGNRIISYGVNSSRTHPSAPSGHWTRTLHAELAALLPFGTVRYRPGTRSELAGVTLYIARVDARGKPAMSMPCKFCHILIRKSKITRIVYTVDEFTYTTKEYD